MFIIDCNIIESRKCFKYAWSRELPIQWISYDNLNINTYLVNPFVTIHIKNFEEDIKEIKEWVTKSCKNKVGYRYSNIWYFENEEDMSAFKLRWL